MDTGAQLFTDEQEPIESQLQRLSNNLEVFMRTPLDASQESLRSLGDSDSFLFRTNPNLLGNSGLSDSKFFGMDENLLVAEIERLAYILDGAWMTIEDFRSQANRHNSLSLNCSTRELQSFSDELAKAARSENPIQLLEVSLSDAHLTLNISQESSNSLEVKTHYQSQAAELAEQKQIYKQKTEQVEATKRALEHYSNNIKAMKIQLLKDKDEIDKAKIELQQQQNLLEEAREDFENRMEDMKKSLESFLEQLELYSEVNEGEGLLDSVTETYSAPLVDDPNVIKQEINYVENLMTSASGKVKEHLQMQLNRLRTRLATLRSAAVLNSCFDITQHAAYKRNYTMTSARSKVTQSKQFVRCTTPLRANERIRKKKHQRVASEVPASAESHSYSLEANQLLLKEIVIIRARLEQKHENFYQREKNLLLEWTADKFSDIKEFHKKLYSLEKQLLKDQEDLDKQKIKFAENAGKINLKEKELKNKQADFQNNIGMLCSEFKQLIHSID